MTQAGQRAPRTSRTKSVSNTIQETKRILFEFNEVEAWQRDNEYLRSKYRNPSNSYKESLRSLFYLHNQTGNIYTHLIGAIVFLVYAVYVYGRISTRYPTADASDLLTFGIFLGSAVVCFGFSASFHIFGNHSSRVYHTWLLLDLYGIFVLIAGTVYSGTYYGFYCEPRYWTLYSAGVSNIRSLPVSVVSSHNKLTVTVQIVAIVTASATFCSLPRFRTPKWRWVRATLFCAIGWTGGFPMTHAAQSFGIEQAHKQMGWWYFIMEGLSYIFGANVYAVSQPTLKSRVNAKPYIR
jgi:adiponectin receptor